jgi:hypothetical protein
LSRFAAIDEVPGRAEVNIGEKRDGGIEIRLIRKFAEDIRPRYERTPQRFGLFEDETAGHEFTDAMREQANTWLLRHLIDKPVLVEDRR